MWIAGAKLLRFCADRADVAFMVFALLIRRFARRIARFGVASAKKD